MELIKPGIGILFWTSISFGLLLFILYKYAWPIILKSLNEREKTIADSLKAAEMAKNEMLILNQNNEKLLNEAKEERLKLIADATQISDKMINDAKAIAKTEANSIINATRKQIELEKSKAVDELKKQIAALSIDIAEKVINKELSDKETHVNFVNKYIEEINLNL